MYGLSIEQAYGKLLGVPLNIFSSVYTCNSELRHHPAAILIFYFLPPFEKIRMKFCKCYILKSILATRLKLGQLIEDSE